MSDDERTTDDADWQAAAYEQFLRDEQTLTWFMKKNGLRKLNGVRLKLKAGKLASCPALKR